MLYTVTCTGCGTDFPVDPRKVPEEGVYAQCSACPQIFFVDRAVLLAATPPSVTFTPPAAVAAEAVQAPAAELEVEPAAVEPPPASAAPPAEVVAPYSESPVTDAPADAPAEAAPSFAAEADPFEAPAAPESTDWQDGGDAAPAAAGASEGEAQPQDTGAVATAAPSFGRRDPHERAGRLARVLVSDMIAYHPDRHSQSLQNETLASDFEEEIEKSWNEYVQQVGQDLAESTPYWRDALNQVLARGQELF